MNSDTAHMLEIHLWGALRPAAGGASVIQLRASTIGQLFRKLEERYPAMQPFIESGLAVAIDGEIYRDNWSQPLPAHKEIYLLPRIEGG